MADRFTAREAAQAALNGKFPLTEQDIAHAREQCLEGRFVGPTNVARLLHHIESLVAAGPPSDALQSVLDERDRQDAKWGEQNHELPLYLTILMEEVGEMSQASTSTRRSAATHRSTSAKRPSRSPAVALAIVECLDRKAARDGR